MRFASIVGARPQFVKLSAVSRALRRRNEEVIIHTGQHYDPCLSDSFFRELSIPKADYHLGIGSGPHGAQTGRMLEAIEGVLAQVRPDGVLVYGDTNSTLAGALAAVKLHIPVAHVEAGLRSFDRAMPEEVNRVLTDHASSRLFCPTETARKHLSREGVEDGVVVVGDVMCDVLLEAKPLLAGRAEALLAKLGVARKAYVLLTIHRAATTDDPERLREAARAVADLGMDVVFPIHPRTRRAAERYGTTWGWQTRVIDPVGYVDMLVLQHNAHRVVTDSGGVQKEAFLLGVPCVTLREQTEWPETVEVGWNTLLNSADALPQAVARPAPQPADTHPFGHGDAALKIARSMESWPPRERAFREQTTLPLDRDGWRASSS
jgi:UDP-GlcNAc3NAcA epimerase